MNIKKLLTIAFACATTLFAVAEDEMTEAGFDKAIREGRALSAERIYRVISEKKGVKPIVFYKGAMLSRAQRKETLVKDRLARYLRTESAWTAEKRSAAWDLSRRNIDATACLALVANEPATPGLRGEACRAVSELRRQGRIDEALKIIEAYLNKYKGNAEFVQPMINEVLAMSYDGNKVFGADAAKKFLDQHPEAGDWDIQSFCDRQYWATGPRWRLDYMAKNKRLLPERAVMRVTDGNFGELWQQCLDKEHKLDAAAWEGCGRQFLSLEPLLQKSDKFFYRWALARGKIVFRQFWLTNRANTNACAQALAAVVADAAKFAKPSVGDHRERMQNLVLAALDSPDAMTQAVGDQLVATYEKFFNTETIRYRVALRGAEKSAQPILATLGRHPDDWTLRRSMAAELAQRGEKAESGKILLEWARREPNGDGNQWLTALNAYPTNALSYAQKAELLQNVFNSIGTTPMLRWMANTETVKRWGGLLGRKEFEPVISLVRKGAKPCHRMNELWMELLGLKRLDGNKCPPRVAEIVDEALKLASDRVPTASKDPSDRRNLDEILSRAYFEFFRHDGEACAKFGKLLIGRVPTNFDSGLLAYLLDSGKLGADASVLLKELLEVGKGTSYDEWCCYTRYTFPSNSTAFPRGMTVAKFSTDALWHLAGYHCNILQLAPSVWADVYAELCKRDFGRELTARHGPVEERYLLERIENSGLMGDKVLRQKLPLAAITDRYLKNGSYGLDVEMRVLRLMAAAGRREEGLKLFYEKNAKRTLSQRLLGLDKLGGCGLVACADDKSLAKEKDEFWPFVKNTYLPALKALPDSDARFYSIPGEVLERAFQVGDIWDAWKNDKQALALRDDVIREFVRLAEGGMTGGARMDRCYAAVLLTLLRSGENPSCLPGLASRTGVLCGYYGTWAFGDIVKTAKEKEQWEPLYLYVTAIQASSNGAVSQGMRASAGKVRSELASKIPGIYPVSEKDPAYPLYVAADEYLQNSHEKAWSLLKKNLLVFERVAIDLPQAFTGWAVDQLRRDRGAKDENLIKAREIATQILGQESKITPDLAAAMILVRAESYRDQQNFEAAKLEYQSIRDNPTYHATPSGKKAMFRATDLAIESGNAESVEQTLEYWQSQNDREIVAQAHYLMAKIAFMRKDYDETIKQLRKVFAIDFTHVEGRFLQGQWKLATNNEVDETEVLIGDLSERSFIRPGTQLSISVQDANLSVAGGGASIPVIVRAMPGGDFERVNLYQSIRDPSRFRGSIDIELGKPNPSNMVLQVTGNDTVSYTIDPAFLASRGLDPFEPKTMRVIDNGKLAVGLGAPKADKNKENADDPFAGATYGGSLRPGNSFYIAVKDRDCSLGGENDTVTVSVSTTSGDKIESFELKEEAPFTGIFRGKVPTALPPPRAYASDTAAGLNPCDVINSRRNGAWQSLSDGKSGKWLAVDTMDSHVFTNIVVTSKSVNDIGTVRLLGSMAGKSMLLGQLPRENLSSRLGLRCRVQGGAAASARTLDELKELTSDKKAAKPSMVSNVCFRLGGDRKKRPAALSAHWWGPFVMPEEYVGLLRLKIVPVSDDRNAMKTAWVTIAIDGEQVFANRGERLANAYMELDVLPGNHKFEMAATGSDWSDEFDLMVVGDDGEASPLPYEMFDVVRHPVLKDYVRDLADIVRTNGTFVATFPVPQRLREFKWVFDDIKTPYVTVEKITAENEKGEKVLPVETDFSDSLNNETLEVAPGDSIVVRYEDRRTTSGQRKTLQASLSSSFNNGGVQFLFEEAAGGGIRSFNAFRYLPGDSIVVAVTDSDLDVSDDADTVDVKITNLDGKSFRKRLTEYAPGSDVTSVHSGRFMGLLRTCAEGDTNAPPNVLRTRPGDILKVAYDDRENTNPGVPFLRTAQVTATKRVPPTITLFHGRTERRIDRSAKAQELLERIRRRAGNENVTNVYTEVLVAAPMTREEIDTTNAIPVLLASAIPVRVNNRSRARHSGSSVTVEAVAHSEIARARQEGRQPEKVRVTLGLGGGIGPYQLTRGFQGGKDALNQGTFSGAIPLSLGPVDPNVVHNVKPLVVNGYDKIDVTVLSEDGKPELKRTLSLVSDARMALTDSSFAAERKMAHIGENLYVQVTDADHDKTDDADTVQITVSSALTGVKRPLVLRETTPHSGVFTGRIKPVIFGPGEEIPNVATGGVVTAEESIKDDRFAISYGDKVIFTYRDNLTLPGTTNNLLAVTGSIFRGASGSVRLFSKRFEDRDAAVLVQFRLAECLFEQAKEHRKLKQPEKSSQAIADGRFLLEEALKNFPDSAHVVQGEFLLANLYQELATEAKEAKNMEKAVALYQDALSRFSQILGTWPEGEYAARSQYHKAYCLEMLQDYARAAEEYVKMTYLFPESDLVGDATIRLATYYYLKEKRYDIAGHIYKNFQQRFPQHNKAARALFMSGSCFIKQAESAVAAAALEAKKTGKPPRSVNTKHFYQEAAYTFETLIDTYRDAPVQMRAQTLYWCGDAAQRAGDYAKSYRNLKRCIFEYPETEWARRARGVLLQNSESYKRFE